MNDVLFVLAVIVGGDVRAEGMITKSGAIGYVEFQLEQYLEMLEFTKWLDKERIRYTIEDEPPAAMSA